MVDVPEGDKFPRSQEAQVCAEIAQAEGDRLFVLGLGGTWPAAEACWRIAAIIRQRLDSVLAPF